ncbi:MAG: HAD-IIIA family hydrolase [Ignavibacteria bacterium]|nr:HAD-IIIA family hydrolase [Ignavibacteria bacterium]
MRKAVFLDRDGTLNKLVYDGQRSESHPPFFPEDLILLEGAEEALHRLISEGYLLFVITNQPDHAKGKTALENIKAVEDNFKLIMKRKGVALAGYYACYHHPEGVETEYAIKCGCRKPGTLFVDKAVNEFDIDRGASWFVGDRVSDVECGRRSGMRTVLLTGGQDEHLSQSVNATVTAQSLSIAAELITQANKKAECHQ